MNTSYSTVRAATATSRACRATQKNPGSTGDRDPDPSVGPCTFFVDDIEITIVGNEADVWRDGVLVDDDEAERAVMEALASW